MANTTKNHNNEGIQPTAIAAGVLAAGAAAAAGYYFYGSKKAAAHRKDAAKWADDMKTEIVREAKRIQKLDQTVIHNIVDRIAGAYGDGKIDPAALTAAASELKENWKRVRGEVTGKKRVVKKMAKKVAKKSAKKRA